MEVITEKYLMEVITEKYLMEVITETYLMEVMDSQNQLRSPMPEGGER
jgi:hypothetical protein